MKGKSRIKKILSIALMFVLLLGCFGGAIPGPDAMAVNESELGNIGLKCVNFNAEGEEWSDLSAATLYNDEPVCLVYKRKTGCRIPAGSYVRAFYASDFSDMLNDHVAPWAAKNHGYTVRYQSRKLARNADQIAWYWDKPWKSGTYIICLIIPCKDKYCKDSFCYYTCKKKINRYG